MTSFMKNNEVSLNKIPEETYYCSEKESGDCWSRNSGTTNETCCEQSLTIMSIQCNGWFGETISYYYEGECDCACCGGAKSGYYESIRMSPDHYIGSDASDLDAYFRKRCECD